MGVASFSGCGFVPSLYREAELLEQLLSVFVDCLVLALATRVVETSLPTLATCEAGWWDVNLYTCIHISLIHVSLWRLTKETMVDHGLEDIGVPSTHPGKGE